MVDLLDRAVDHQGDEVVLVGLADGPRADERAVAQDRDAVGELEDLFEPMADIDDRDAPRLEAADQLEQGGRFRAGEIGRRLIEDQKLGAAPFGAGGRHQLLLADGERGEKGAGGQIEAELVEQLLALAHHRAVLQHAEAHLLVAEKEIGRHGQMRAEHDLLVDGVDADADRLVRTGERDGLALPEDFAAAARVDAGEQLDEGRLSRAVLADDCMDLALVEGEVHRFQRVGRAEPFVELVQAEERGRGGGAIRLHRQRVLPWAV